MYLFRLLWVVVGVRGLSPVVVSRGCSLVVVCELLTVLTSLVRHRL